MPLEPLAVASVVTGALALGPVAGVLAVIALRRIRARGTRGRGLARTGLTLGVVGTLVLVGVLVGAALTARNARPLPPDVTAPRDAHARQLVTGSCLDPLPTGTEVDAVHVVPCSDQHAAQVVTVYAFDDAAVWPGQAAADARVAASCDLTPAEREAGVRAVAWAPTEESWRRGDRLGLCLATTDAGELTGSFLDGTVHLP
ncbi:hypothetical protein DDP54_06845 [Cellulomonas sp. WB94]|uniref:DUF4190 domain-containing protein n=1 Tax=Cellulomonas sp. WB94 TaxID=2173174 RepID=UPI000D582550|nr:DUF4190 domain-containing protein [Cellulomonas sp. WB94]PVU82773.1 hypothetical protein DDP54_06845 [Cellulomonas sp. WB94]